MKYNRVWAFITEEKVKVLLISILAVLSVVLSMIPAALIQWFIDHVLLHKKSSMLFMAFGLIVGFRIIAELTRGLFRITYAKFIFGVMNKIKEQLFHRLINMPYLQYRRAKEKSLHIFTNDVDSLLQSGIEMIPVMMISVLVGIGGSIYLASVNFLFFVGLCILAGISVWPLYFINKKQDQLVAQAQSDEMQQTSYLTEFIDKPLFVKTNYYLNTMIKDFRVIANNLMKSNLQRELNFRVFLIIRDVFDALVPAFILAYGGYLFFQNQISTGQIVGCLFILPFVLEPLKNISTYYLTFKGIIPRVNRINELLSTKVDDVEDNKDLHISKENIEICFKDVSLYLEDRQVLKDFNWVFKSNEHVLITGPSGAGKSTLFNLLLGIYRPDQGEITINGLPIEHFGTSQLKHIFAVSLQTAFFFKGTIKENITIMNPDADLEIIRHALKVTCCEEFIQDLPDGIDTELEENGDNISGGQRQRLALARAIISGRSILLLDESTSALEPELEDRILRNISEEVDMTIIQISHRSEKPHYIVKEVTLKAVM